MEIDEGLLCACFGTWIWKVMSFFLKIIHLATIYHTNPNYVCKNFRWITIRIEWAIINYRCNDQDKNKTMEVYFAKESRIKPCELVGHILLVHVVKLVKWSSGGEATLHQVQHWYHAWKEKRSTDHVASEDTGFAALKTGAEAWTKFKGRFNMCTQAVLEHLPLSQNELVNLLLTK